MYRTSRLLLVSIAAVVLMAPPASSQARKTTLDDVVRDLLDVKGAVGEMQRSVDAKNLEMKTLLEQILARFGSIDSSVQKLGESLTAIKATDETSARELRDARVTVNEIKKSLDTFNQLNLGETLTNMGTQLGALKKQVTELQNTEAPLPAAGEVFSAAWAELHQGFYDLAIGDFKDFLNTYPKDPRAPMAQLSLGNAYFNAKKFDQALIEYELTFQKYPDSDKKCIALYKKGQTLVELKQPTQAITAAFQAVGKECPNSDESKLATEDLRKLRPGQRGN